MKNSYFKNIKDINILEDEIKIIADALGMKVEDVANLSGGGNHTFHDTLEWFLEDYYYGWGEDVYALFIDLSERNLLFEYDKNKTLRENIDSLLWANVLAESNDPDINYNNTRYFKLKNGILTIITDCL